MKEPMNKAMNSSAITISSKRWQKLPWLLMFFFLSTTFTLNSASSSATQPSYKDHCASIIPEPEHSSQKAPLGSFPLSRSHGGYYTSGNPLLNSKLNRYYRGSAFLNSVSFRTMAVYAATDSQDLFKVEGTLTFQGANTYNHQDSSSRYGGRGGYRRNSVAFSLSGFWSESSGNLCMVGSSNQLNLPAVLKLHNLTKNANITGLFTGTLESLSSADAPDHFEPISILTLPQMNYKYTNRSADSSNRDSDGGRDIPSGMSHSHLPEKTLCPIVYKAVDQFNLKYSRGCNSTKIIKGKRCPGAFSRNMRFVVSIKQSKLVGTGYAKPLFVGDRFYDVPGNRRISSPVNISYRIDLTLFNSSSYKRWKILAEGIYDAERGRLCMVGCRNVGSDRQIPIDDPKDCDILVKFQFPPLNSKNAGKINGSNTSTRKKPHFETPDLSASAFYGDPASIWRMDMERIIILISTTLSCVLVVLQIVHVKRHPDVLPLISLVTLSVLTLGHMITLLLNFEALFFDNHGYPCQWFVKGGLVEENGVIVMVAGMVAFLLQFHLLEQTWSARLGDGNHKALWIAEKKATFVVLVFYEAGAFLAFRIANWNEPQQHQYGMIFSGSMDYTQRFRWEGLKPYAGLVLDGFLLPQILLNMFRNSKENALSVPFYIGTTFVRVLPHAYDLYRAHMYAHQYDGSSYMLPLISQADYYSTAWDVVILLGGLLFAVIIYLQQRFGGRCTLPGKYRELEVYEKVPVVSDAC